MTPHQFKTRVYYEDTDLLPDKRKNTIKTNS